MHLCKTKQNPISPAPQWGGAGKPKRSKSKSTPKPRRAKK